MTHTWMVDWAGLYCECGGASVPPHWIGEDYANRLEAVADVARRYVEYMADPARGGRSDTNDRILLASMARRVAALQASPQAAPEGGEG